MSSWKRHLPGKSPCLTKLKRSKLHQKLIPFKVGWRRVRSLGPSHCQPWAEPAAAETVGDQIRRSAAFQSTHKIHRKTAALWMQQSNPGFSSQAHVGKSGISVFVRSCTHIQHYCASKTDFTGMQAVFWPVSARRTEQPGGWTLIPRGPMAPWVVPQEAQSKTVWETQRVVEKRDCVGCDWNSKRCPNPPEVCVISRPCNTACSQVGTCLNLKDLDQPGGIINEHPVIGDTRRRGWVHQVRKTINLKRCLDGSLSV